MIKGFEIDISKCIHCGKCQYSCFNNVIEWDEERMLPYVKYPQDCQLCCICEAVCPVKALQVIPDFSAKYYPRYISTMRRDEQWKDYMN